MKRIILRNGEEDRILRGHPWVYDNEVDCVLTGKGAGSKAAAAIGDNHAGDSGNSNTFAELLESGECADVESARKEYLGRAIVNPNSKIIARIYSPSKEGLDKGFFKRRIREALQRRAAFRDLSRESARIVFAEADFLPGLIIDRFVGWPLAELETAVTQRPLTFELAQAALGPPQSWLSVQFLAWGMDSRREMILEAADEALASLHINTVPGEENVEAHTNRITIDENSSVSFFKKISIGKAEKWLIENVRKTGLDIEGYIHEITTDFIQHVYKEHGNERTESKRGNIAITVNDIEIIPEIIYKPDFIILGLKRDGENRIIYTKKLANNTTLYFEEILTGKRNKSLRGKTYYKKEGSLSKEGVVNILKSNQRNDVSHIKIISRDGGQSIVEVNRTIDPTEAASAQPTDNSIITRNYQKARGIIEKFAMRIRELEGLPLREELIRGTIPPGGIVIFENGLPFAADLPGGQKTGHFLDQRDNRLLTGKCAALLCEEQQRQGKAADGESDAIHTPGDARPLRVLDMCSYTGGFSIHVLRAAENAEVTAVDVSAVALEAARKNAALNGVAEKFTTIEGDIFETLRTFERKKEKADIVILDPPAFAKSRTAVGEALRGYKEINLQAIKLLRQGGILITCSCSQALDEGRFKRMIVEAAADAERRLVQIDFRYQGPDHPVLIGYDESLYLKCGVYRVL
ncbi:hypothetical protein AGMMS50293_19310 [Spirochaetia bacterium]|nr:hypothetical protein AGMMS50293_19310 [Spirochaetia bacterium]